MADALIDTQDNPHQAGPSPGEEPNRAARRTFQEIRHSEGYYLDLETSDLLRNVLSEDYGGGATPPWTDALGDPVAARFVLLTEDVLLPLEAVQRLAVARFGGARPSRLINRQTAAQPEGGLRTEVARSVLRSPSDKSE